MDDSDDQDDDEDDDEDDIAPPLPPRRSESLLKSNFYNNGTQEQVQQQDSNPVLSTDLPTSVMFLEGKKIPPKKLKKTSILLKTTEEQVKTYLKPKFNEGLISKENYKTIMRKCIEKIYAKHRAPVSNSKVSIERVQKVVNEYVEIYKKR